MEGKMLEMKVFGISTILFFVILVFSVSSVVFAGDFGDIQDEIDSGSTDINLGNDIYTPVSVDSINVNKNNVVIKGQSANSKAVLDAAGSNSRIMRISGSNVRLENLVFKNVNANIFGGGISSNGGNLTIINCDFINNGAMVGAIVLDNSSTNVLIQNCTFINNVAAYSNTSGGGGGGAIDSHSSNGQIINCRFTGNSAIGGGGAVVFMFGTNNTVSGCTFTNNTASNGGAIATATAGTTLKIINTNFNNNKANKNNGGAIYSINTITIDNSNFTSNSAINGGAIYSNGVSKVSKSKFTSNFADYGSAIYSNNNLNVTSTTFSNNKAKTSITLSLPYGIRYNHVSVIADKAKYNPTVVQAVLTKNDNIADSIWQTNSGSTHIDNKKQALNNLLASQTLTLNSKYSSTTDSKGIALIKFNEDTLTDFKGLTKTSSGYNYKFSVSYGGNNLYASSSASLSTSAKVSDNFVDSYWNLMTKKVTSTKTTTTYAINKTGWYKKAITYTKVSKPSSSGTWKKYNTKTKTWKSSKAYTKATSVNKVIYKNMKNNVVYVINKTGWYKKSSWIKLSKPSSSGTWKKYNTKTKTWKSSGAYTNPTSVTRVYYKNTITTNNLVNNGLKPYVKTDLKISTTIGKNTTNYIQKGIFINSTDDIYFKDDLTDKERTKYKEALINHDANKKWVHVHDPAVKKQLIILLKDTNYSRVNGKLTSLSKAKAIYNWVVYKEKYKVYLNSKHSDTWSIKEINKINGKGSDKIDLINCADHSNLLVSLLRTAGIPAVYVHNHVYGGHYWASAYVKYEYNGKAVTSWHWLDTIHSYFKYNLAPTKAGTGMFKANPKLAIDSIKYPSNSKMVTKTDLGNHLKYWGNMKLVAI
jgi:predicted outer membrane repeat protein